MHSSITKMSGFTTVMLLQITFLILFWVFVRYDKGSLPLKLGNETTEQRTSIYAHFQDIQVMILIGFGFLMTFLRKYGFSATGFTLWLTALIIQWSILVKGVFHTDNGKILISLKSIAEADITAAVPLISMGAMLGRTTPIQLLFMAVFEVALFALNEYIAVDILSICDVGGSITVHAFGAYFGLGLSLMLRPNKEQNEAGKYEGSSYISDVFAMIGTVFLWIFWPSFNSVLASGSGVERAILNTYLSLASATVTTFVISAFVSHNNKLDMVHVQNSTLAGGVAVGTVCNLLIGPHGALLIGIIAGAVSVLGYHYITPFITSKLRIHDTCGVHNLHGMPAIISAIASAIYAAMATKADYQSELEDIFPAMSSPENIQKENNSTMEFILGGYGRSASSQAGYQLIGIAMTVFVAIVGGILTGIILKFTSISKLQKDEHHQDECSWEVPENKED